jgi:DNA-binding PadR family transcriptional regulator
MSELPSWTSDAHSNFVFILVLEIIKQNTTYGYEIKKKIENFMNKVYKDYEFKISSLYTLLRRLERDSLIEPFKDIDSATNERDKSRTFYTITTKGNNALNTAWEEWNSLLTVFNLVNQHLGDNTF